jgi:hypothetical protein
MPDLGSLGTPNAAFLRHTVQGGLLMLRPAPLDNVFSHPDFVSSGNENPNGMDHFCLSVDAATVDDVIADLRHKKPTVP